PTEVGERGHRSRERQQATADALSERRSQLAGLVSNLRERAFPRLGAGYRLAGHLDRDGRTFGHAGRAAREQIFGAALVRDNGIAAVGAHDRQATTDDSSGRHSSVQLDPRLENLVAVDQYGARFADAALDQPFRQSGSPRFSGGPGSRRAGDRPRWNSCPRYGGRTLRHSPGAHSRPLSRAIRHGSYNSRSLRRSAASSRSSSRPAARGLRPRARQEQRP